MKMNQYQKHFMCDDSKNLCALALGSEIEPYQNALKEDKIVLKQLEDITYKDYSLCIVNAAIEAVFSVVGTKQTPFEKRDDRFILPIDFDHKINRVKIVFKNGLADDLILPVVYEEADKEAYYAEKEKERQKKIWEERHKAINVFSATGYNLVNIYFQPCCEEYAKTEITLYRLDRNRNRLLMAVYQTDKGAFFKSIEGLAFGEYEYILKQYDKNGKLLWEEQSRFRLEVPGRGHVTI